MTILKSQALRSKRKVLNKVMEKMVEQYTMLENYIDVLLRKNLGSIIVMEIDNDKIQIFQKIYLFFKTTKIGFVKGRRKVIFMDGCHLKSTIGGQLLTTTRIDPNNSLQIV